MYGSPYINPQVNIDRINQQIQDLERLKGNIQSIPQQPIQNIINTSSGVEFEARFLNDNENPEEILIQRKTAFISLKKGKLTIKELNGDLSTYDLLIPKTPEQLRIEELERRLEEYEHRANNEVSESRANDNESNESTTKNSGRTISKKS